MQFFSIYDLIINKTKDKNMLCNTSVIQCITKKFQEIRIIFPSYVCWLSLKGLPLHPQSREMRHFRQCVTDLVKQT